MKKNHKFLTSLLLVVSFILILGLFLFGGQKLKNWRESTYQQRMDAKVYKALKNTGTYKIDKLSFLHVSKTGQERLQSDLTFDHTGQTTKKQLEKILGYQDTLGLASFGYSKQTIKLPEKITGATEINFSFPGPVQKANNVYLEFKDGDKTLRVLRSFVNGSDVELAKGKISFLAGFTAKKEKTSLKMLDYLKIHAGQEVEVTVINNSFKEGNNQKIKKAAKKVKPNVFVSGSEFVDNQFNLKFTSGEPSVKVMGFKVLDDNKKDFTQDFSIKPVMDKQVADGYRQHFEITYHGTDLPTKMQMSVYVKEFATTLTYNYKTRVTYSK